nr:sn1-specific diacylglycerol lipase beta isoform X2 [Ipomoea batatas]
MRRVSSGKMLCIAVPSKSRKNLRSESRMDIEEILKMKLATIKEEPAVEDGGLTEAQRRSIVTAAKMLKKMHLKVKMERLFPQHRQFNFKESYVLFMSGLASKGECDSRRGFLEHDHCPGNLRRDGGGEGRHCGHLRHRSLALEFALESSRRAFLSPSSLRIPIPIPINARYSLSSKLCEEPLPVPEEMIHEAALFHPFAEAVYTGLLLDDGRNPILFPLSWLCRQGVFSPSARKSRPLLEGDNWWRGHSAAFLKYVKLTDDVLRKGRVNQDKCKAAYFIVVLHHSKTVVIVVHGTETPEDLITDGLCRECSLSEGDLDGLHFQLRLGDHNLGWVSTLTMLTHFIWSIHLDDLPTVALVCPPYLIPP